MIDPQSNHKVWRSLYAQGKADLRYPSEAFVRLSHRLLGPDRPGRVLDFGFGTGANLVHTVARVKAVVDQIKKTWPEAVPVSFTQDKSKTIRTMLADLQNSVVMGVLLVTEIGRASCRDRV